MASYLLTCNCGLTLPVDVGQAGGQVVCSCGTRLDVPTLRNLRHLPVASTVQPSTVANWSPKKGTIAVFLIGAALLAAASLWNRLTEPKLPEFQPQVVSQAINKRIDQLKPVDVWKEWILVYRPLAERGFTPLEASNAAQIHAVIARKRFLESVLLIVAGVCLGIAALAVLWPTAATRTRR